MPVCITICALLGVLTASATRARYGTSMWQPLVILEFAQKEYYTPGGRALTFFAGLSIWLHQVFVNVTQNNVGAGMDLAGVFPRYISMQRGAILVAVAGVIVQPWRFFTQATVFISVISSFAGKSLFFPLVESANPVSLRLSLYCYSHPGLLGCPQGGLEGSRSFPGWA
jgi:NCS1 family nucleobase:cation symporter-1